MEENIRNGKNVGLIVDPHIQKPQDQAQACFSHLQSPSYAQYGVGPNPMTQIQ